MFDVFYRNIYYLGLKSGFLLRDAFRVVFRKLKVPLKAIGTVFTALFFWVARLISAAVHRVTAEVKDLFSDIHRVQAKIRDIWKNDRKSVPKLFRTYARKALGRHGAVFRFAVNTGLPIAAFVLLCVVIGQYSDRTLALEVTYNDSVIGYVESEAVYHEAQEQASARLATAAKVESATVNESTGYAIKSVKRSELRDATVLCDEIIERSNRKVTNACGIYIDDVFLCAVKNETDATAVFDNILRNFESDDQNAVVGFVEDISYVQGLYPDGTETVWDASRLAKQLDSKKTAAEYYTVEAGDTVSGIAQKFGLSTAELFALNPGVGETIKLGQQLLVSREVSYIQVQVTKTETRTVSVPYQTVKEESASLYSGTKRTKQKGVAGEQVITELVTYVDGVRTSVKEISRETTREPVDEIIQVGTKRSSYSGYSGSYSTTSYSGRFIWPAVGAYSISSGFGYRRSGFHGGIDIVKPGGGSTGAPVVAAGSGTVATAGYHPSYGYHVIINHGGGVSTLYAHMLRGSLKVSAGQSVSAGQALGNIGSTGNVTGPHLHFEVRINGNRVNPLPYLGR